MISQRRLKELVTYIEDTGEFLKDGKEIGSVRKNGYVQIKIDNKAYLAHRLAWIYVNGDIRNEYDIDHINMNRSDNRICNLRIATRSQNMQNAVNCQSNNKTGLRGVSFEKRSGRYFARICKNGIQIRLGWFDTAKEAYDCYLENKKIIHEYCPV